MESLNFYESKKTIAPAFEKKPGGEDSFPDGFPFEISLDEINRKRKVRGGGGNIPPTVSGEQEEQEILPHPKSLEKKEESQ